MMWTDCWPCSPSLRSVPLCLGPSPTERGNSAVRTHPRSCSPSRRGCSKTADLELSIGGRKGLLGNKLPRPSPPPWGGEQREEQTCMTRRCLWVDIGCSGVRCPCPRQVTFGSDCGRLLAMPPSGLCLPMNNPSVFPAKVLLLGHCHQHCHLGGSGGVCP